jgi:hypothetical protein
MLLLVIKKGKYQINAIKNLASSMKSSILLIVALFILAALCNCKLKDTAFYFADIVGLTTDETINVLS